MVARHFSHLRSHRSQGLIVRALLTSFAVVAVLTTAASAKEAARFPTAVQGQWCYVDTIDGVSDYLSPGALGHECSGGMENLTITHNQLSANVGVESEQMVCDLISGQLGRDTSAVVYRAKMFCEGNDRRWTETSTFIAETRGQAALTWRTK